MIDEKNNIYEQWSKYEYPEFQQCGLDILKLINDMIFHRHVINCLENQKPSQVMLFNKRK